MESWCKPRITRSVKLPLLQHQPAEEDRADEKGPLAHLEAGKDDAFALKNRLIGIEDPVDFEIGEIGRAFKQGLE